MPRGIFSLVTSRNRARAVLGTGPWPRQPDTILGKCATRHAATECWLSTPAIFLQPSIRRNLICPLTTRPKSRISAASSLGSEPCVFTRRRNSSWSRSIVFVVRNVFHLQSEQMLMPIRKDADHAQHRHADHLPGAAHAQGKAVEVDVDHVEVGE